MLWWVIYDISEDKVRNSIASKCKNYGLERVQKSAFLGELTKNKAEMLAIEVKDALSSPNDCVFILPSCTSCFADKIVGGSFEFDLTSQKDFIVVSG